MISEPYFELLGGSWVPWEAAPSLAWLRERLRALPQVARPKALQAQRL